MSSLTDLHAWSKLLWKKNTWKRIILRKWTSLQNLSEDNLPNWHCDFKMTYELIVRYDVTATSEHIYF